MRCSFLALLAFLAAACKDKDVSVYRVPKEERPAAGAPMEPQAPGLSWSVPKGWTPKPASEMRLASFSVAGKDGRQADVSIVKLPGEAGGILANVNRWRGQLGLGPLDERGLGSSTRRLKTRAGEVLAVDLRSEGNEKRLLAAILSAEGETWFFKMAGDESAVSSGEPSFRDFLNSLRRDSN